MYLYKQWFLHLFEVHRLESIVNSMQVWTMVEWRQIHVGLFHMTR